MDDLLSFLYTVIDTLSLVFFLDAFATRRWDNWKFKLGVGCFVALLFLGAAGSVCILRARSGYEDWHDSFVVHDKRKSPIQRDFR